MSWANISRSGCLALACLLWLAGCGGNPPQPQPTPQPEPAKPRGPSPEEIRQRAVNYFLQRAEEAERRGFLTEPAGASAYDHYLRVRQLDPGNIRATSGIQIIVLELVAGARDALRRRAFGQVNSLLNRAEELAPGNPLTAEVRAQLRRERSRARVNLPAGESVQLPAAQLATRSEAVIELLRDTAQRIRREELRVIIVARNDAEGRWVYQQLREAVPGYRVRGDIKLGGSPQLLLIQPGGR